MSLQFTCPKCDRRYTVPEGFASKPARCKACQTKFLVPKIPAPVAVSPAGTTLITADGVASSSAKDSLAALRSLLTRRRLNKVGLLGLILLGIGVVLPWLEISGVDGSLVRMPQEGFGPRDLISGDRIDLIGVEFAQPPLLARVAFLLVPLLIFLALWREFATVGQGQMPRLAFVLAALAPLVAAALAAWALSQPDGVVRTGTVAQEITDALTAASSLGQPAFTAILETLRPRLSIGLSITALGGLCCLVAAMMSKSTKV